MLDAKSIIKENEKRLAYNSRTYNPYTGEGCDSIVRVHIQVKDCPYPEMWIPEEMMQYDAIKLLAKYKSINAVLQQMNMVADDDARHVFWEEFIRLRIIYDFEFWAASFFFIKDKVTSKNRTLILKRSQRELNKIVFKQRREIGYIRLIIDKGRQMGLSTYCVALNSWMQLVVHTQWNSVICAHVENTARIIRGMYTKNLKAYPAWLIDNNLRIIKHTPYEGSNKTRYIESRDCRVSVGSSEAPEALRGEDVTIAHLSEVGLWKATQGKKPEDLVENIVSSVSLVPDSIIIFESTAKGIGNYFHREWLRAKDPEQESEYRPVFLAWFYDDDYTLPIKDYDKFISSMNAYEHYLFELGATLEAIAWYRKKKKGQLDEWRFKSEFPSTDIESFQSTGHRFYPVELTQKLRRTCSSPAYIGEVIGKAILGQKECLNDLHFSERDNGQLKVWSLPAEREEVTERYVVVVDIGGRSSKADNSVICVFDRYWMSEGDVPEVVAEWAGHIEHYKLAWMAAQIAKYYHNALLVFESNTYEMEGTEGDHSQFILDEIAEHYPNLYVRPTPADKVKEDAPVRYGFQTNRSTKPLVCDFMLKQLDTDPYIEHCSEAVDEFETFEVHDGKLDAVEGCHDDRHITRAIGLWICYRMKPPIAKTNMQSYTASKRVVSEASI